MNSTSTAVAVTGAKRKPRLTLKAPADKISEAQRQQAVITTLRSLGYEVLLLGQKRQPIFCKCGKKHWPITTANTPGTPDLMVSHARWAKGKDGYVPPNGQLAPWCGIEMKAPGTTRRPEQMIFNAQGFTAIVETVQEALDAVLRLEKAMGIPPLPAMTAYKEQL